MDVSVRPISEDKRSWARRFIRERWGSDLVAYSYACYPAWQLDGLIAESDGVPLGLLTLSREASGCEIVTLDAVKTGMGVGTSLVEAVAQLALKEGRRWLRVTTTNDNLDALRFYQRRDFRIVDLLTGGADAARMLKPQIPEDGEYGIPVHDEIVLERVLF